MSAARGSTQPHGRQRAAPKFRRAAVRARFSPCLIDFHKPLDLWFAPLEAHDNKARRINPAVPPYCYRSLIVPVLFLKAIPRGFLDRGTKKLPRSSLPRCGERILISAKALSLQEGIEQRAGNALRGQVSGTMQESWT